MKDWGLAKVTLNVADGSMKEDISSWLVFGLLVALFAVAMLAPGPVAAIAAVGGEVSGIATVAIGCVNTSDINTSRSDSVREK